MTDFQDVDALAWENMGKQRFSVDGFVIVPFT